MRLLHVAVLALGLASASSFAHEAPDRDSPDQKRDQSADDYFSTSWTETATRGASVVIIVHPHAQTHTNYEADTGKDDVARASTGDPQPCSASIASTASATADLNSTPAALASPSPTPTARLTAASPPPSRITTTVLSSPLESLGEISPMKTYSPNPSSLRSTDRPKKPIDSSQTQVCAGGSYVSCVASYSCNEEPTDATKCYCRNNVRESCNDACGGHQKIQPEECPVLPVSERPPGLPGPGVGPRLLRRRRYGYDYNGEEPVSEGEPMRRWWWYLGLVNALGV